MENNIINVNDPNDWDSDGHCYDAIGDIHDMGDEYD